MKKNLGMLVAIVIALVLLSYMLLFQVQENEIALRATFGSADEKSIIQEKGLHFRLPWPFQQIHRYTTRTQIAETALDTVQTRDGYTVNIRLYLTWRIADPLKFHKSLKDEESARSSLGTILRNSNGAISNVRFNQLVNTDAKEMKLGQVEAELLAAVQADMDKQESGVKVEHVGVRRIVLPPSVNTKVFERMKSDRENLASGVKTRGTAQAGAIVAEARSIRESILSFSNKHAQEVRTRGETLAAEVYKEFARDEDFGIFLRQLEALEKILTGANRPTIIMDATKVDDINPFRLFTKEPGNKAAPVAPVVTPPLKPAGG